MFAPGARVMAVYANGEAYAATVAEAGAGTYTVDWDDGDQRHRVRQARDVFALVSPAECGGEGDDGGGRRTHRGKVPALAESAEESLNRKRSHEQAQLARDNAPARRKVAKPRPPELRTNDLAATGINPQPRHVAPVREGESVTVVGREREVEEILGFCKQCVTGGGGGRGGPSASGGRVVHGGSLYISGAPGVGKTLTIHTVQRLLASWRGAQGRQPRIENINAMQIQDPEHVFVLIHQALYPTAPTPDRSQARETLKKRLQRSWAVDTFTTFLFIDEIDGLLTAANTSVLYALFEWPFMPESRLVVVGVANSIDLTDRTLPYLKQKRCEPKTVHFKAYDQEQLARIIVHMQRKVKTTQAAAITAGGGCGADSGGGGDGGGADGSWARTGDGDWRVGLSRVTLEQDAINFCARKVASVSGDARKLLALCSAAARIAVRDAAEASQEPQKEAAGSARGESESVPVEITHVVAAAKEIFGGNVIDILQRGLTTTQQLAVCAFVLLLRKGESGHVTLATLYAEFRQLCRRQQLEHMCVDKSEFISLCENALAAQRVLAMSDAPRGRARPSSSSARGRGKKIGGLRRGGGGGGLGGDGRKVTLQVKESDVMKALGQKGLYKRILVVDELRRPEQQ